MNVQQKIRVLITKHCADVHDRGMRYIARVLRDAGIEIIFTRFETISEVVTTALQEDVGIIAVSSYSGGHLRFCDDLTTLMKQKNIENIMILLGGIIPEDDIPELESMGVSWVIKPGTPSEDIVNWVFSHTA